MQENCFLNQITRRKETNPIIIFATNIPLTEKPSNQSAPVKCAKKKKKNPVEDQHLKQQCRTKTNCIRVTFNVRI